VECREVLQEGKAVILQIQGRLEKERIAKKYPEKSLVSRIS